jgi:hypothetical protein
MGTISQICISLYSGTFPTFLVYYSSPSLDIVNISLDCNSDCEMTTCIKVPLLFVVQWFGRSRVPRRRTHGR